MNTMDLVRFVDRARERQQAPRRAVRLFYANLVGPVRQAILRARQLLLSEQQADGSWNNARLSGRTVGYQR
jgi:hypothetical protein